jgi:hypothetical protein
MCSGKMKEYSESKIVDGRKFPPNEDYNGYDPDSDFILNKYDQETKNILFDTYNEFIKYIIGPRYSTEHDEISDHEKDSDLDNQWDVSDSVFSGDDTET